MRLVVFDIDGTLVDSQHHIHRAMNMAFEHAGLEPLDQPRILGVVGLSLPVAVAELAPEADPPTQARIVAGYKACYRMARLAEEAPLYPGALACLRRLSARDDLLLAVATGKSRQGLLALIDTHGLNGIFASLQTADDHPSKPNPEMLAANLSDTGIIAAQAVMIGDTSFDIQMACNAGMVGFGVAWGYHPEAALFKAGATLVARDFPALTASVEEWAS